MQHTSSAPRITWRLVDEGSKRSVICSLYISRKEHLQLYFSLSSLLLSSSYQKIETKHCKKEIKYNNRTIVTQFIYIISQTSLILLNKYSNTRGVIPQSSLSFPSMWLMSPIIVYVFPLPVCRQQICRI